MEDPVEKITDLKENKISLKTPPGIWIPLFTDFITTIPGRSDLQEFRPRGPFYLPLGMRLLDARTQELSLSKIKVPTDGSLISRITMNYLVRAHQNTPHEIGYYKTLIWASFNRKIATEKKLKIYFILSDNKSYYFGDPAQPTQSSVEQDWRKIRSIQGFNPQCQEDQKTHQVKSCNIWVKNLKRVILSYQLVDNNPKSEILISIHRKDQTPFNINSGWNDGSGISNPAFKLIIGLFNQGLDPTNQKTGPNGKESDHFTMLPTYFNGDGKGETGDVIYFSIGRKSQLDHLGLGY